MPKITVIIVNYRRNETIDNCLKALSKQTFVDFEVVVIDNGSVSASADQIEESIEIYGLAKIVKLIAMDMNLGFAGGNVEGLKYASGQYVALLNNDAEPERGWLEDLVRAIETYPDVAVCASRLIVYKTDVVDSAGDGFCRSLQGFKRCEGKETKEFSEQEFIFGACAGAALYRRTMLDDIGFFDEDFFLIHEDTDLNFRAQLAGWKVLYVPTALVYHKVRSSIVDMSDIAVYHTIRNRDFVRIKNVPFTVFIRCLPEFVLGAIMEFLYFVIKHGKLRLYCRAKYDVLKNFSKMMIKRKAIMKKKRVNDKYIYSLMTPLWEKDFLKRKLKKIIYG
jgi:GT2 family glycosyltransferase